MHVLVGPHQPAVSSLPSRASPARLAGVRRSLDRRASHLYVCRPGVQIQVSAPSRNHQGHSRAPIPRARKIQAQARRDFRFESSPSVPRDWEPRQHFNDRRLRSRCFLLSRLRDTSEPRLAGRRLFARNEKRPEKSLISKNSPLIAISAPL
jgi:hypothetical protein